MNTSITDKWKTIFSIFEINEEFWVWLWSITEGWRECKQQTSPINKGENGEHLKRKGVCEVACQPVAIKCTYGSNYTLPLILKWMPCHFKGHSGSFEFFFSRWKANFLACQGANKKQTATVTLHQVAGLSAGGRRRTDSRWEVRKEECGQPPLSFPTRPSLVHIMRWGQAEPLCIGLINSYSSSAWHPGSRSGFALGLIFRPADDSRSIRAPLRRRTANFPEVPEEAKGTEGENERVIERGVDDIEGWGWEWCGEIEKEGGSAPSLEVIYDV